MARGIASNFCFPCNVSLVILVTLWPGLDYLHGMSCLIHNTGVVIRIVIILSRTFFMTIHDYWHISHVNNGKKPVNFNLLEAVTIGDTVCNRSPCKSYNYQKKSEHYTNVYEMRTIVAASHRSRIVHPMLSVNCGIVVSHKLQIVRFQQSRLATK